jgi:hypothetical protein
LSGIDRFVSEKAVLSVIDRFVSEKAVLSGKDGVVRYDKRKLLVTYLN